MYLSLIPVNFSVTKQDLYLIYRNIYQRAFFISNIMCLLYLCFALYTVGWGMMHNALLGSSLVRCHHASASTNSLGECCHFPTNIILQLSIKIVCFFCLYLKYFPVCKAPGCKRSTYIHDCG